MFSTPMGKYATIAQAETYALMKSANALLERGITGEKITVFSDSKSTLQALSRDATDSALLRQCYESLHSLGRNNQVSLEWIPAHQGYWGNELADKLAKNSITSLAEGERLRPFIGPEPYLPLASSTIQSTIKDWERDKHIRRWRKEDGSNKHAKSVIESPRYDSRSLDRLNKKPVRLLSFVYTGHGPWKYHLHKLDPSISPFCERCGQSCDTPTHFVNFCEALCVERILAFGCIFGDGNLIKNATQKDLLEFIRLTKKFKKPNAHLP